MVELAEQPWLCLGLLILVNTSSVSRAASLALSKICKTISNLNIRSKDGDPIKVIFFPITITIKCKMICH